MAVEGCPDFSIVPGVPLCTDACAALSLCKLPKTYPKTTAVSTLQAAYSLDSDKDFQTALIILPDAYGIPVSDTADASIIEDPCEEMTSAESRPFYSYIDVMQGQESLVTRSSSWILDYTERTCIERTTGITKGPAYQSLYNTIQEILSPPTVTPGVIPGVAQRTGTRIPKPKGDCEGTWRLTYKDGKLVWECDSSSSDIMASCSGLQMESISIVGEPDGDALSSITTEDVLKYPNPYIRIDYKYQGIYMPAVSLDLDLSISKQDPYKDPCASAGWINYPFPVMGVTIGDIYSDDVDPDSDKLPEDPSIQVSELFRFSWSAVECYKKSSADTGEETSYPSSSAVTIQVRATVPICPEIGDVSTSVDVSCADATGELAIANDWYIVDKWGYVVPDNSIGLLCNEVRAGEYSIVITYVNTGDGVYLGADDSVAQLAHKTDGLNVAIGQLTAPSMLKPGESETVGLPFTFELLEGFCGGVIGISIPGVDDVIEVPINAACTECPTFNLTGITLVDKSTGVLLGDTWNVGCVASASKDIIVSAVFEAADPGVGYTNWNSETVEFSVNISGEGIMTNIPHTIAITVPNIDKGENKQVSASIECIVSTDDSLKNVESSNDISGTVEFAVVSKESGGQTATLNITSPCGAIRADGECYILWRPEGAEEWNTKDTKITACAPGRYEIKLVAAIINASTENINTTIYATFTGSAGGGASIVSSKTQEVTVNLVNLTPMRTRHIESNIFTIDVGDTNEEFDWWTKISYSIPEHSISCESGIAASPNCGSSSESSGSSSSDVCGDDDPECCPWIESADERVIIGKNIQTGRCTIALSGDIGGASSTSPDGTPLDLCALVEAGKLVGDEDGIDIECTEDGVVVITNTAPGGDLCALVDDGKLVGSTGIDIECKDGIVTIASDGTQIGLCALVDNGDLVGGNGIDIACKDGVVTVTNTATEVTYKAGGGISINDKTNTISVNAGTGLSINSSSGAISVNAAYIKGLLSGAGGITYTSSSGAIAVNAGTGLKIVNNQVVVDEDWISSWLVKWLTDWVDKNTQPCA